MRLAFAGLLVMASAASCAPPPEPPAPATRYMVGEPYELGGIWSYPKEDFGLDERGVASVLPTARPRETTANGEAYRADWPVAAHRTLQLPAIVWVTNLETGREIRVRVNDRGPTQAGRIIGLSPRAAQLLGIVAGATTQVRVRMDAPSSLALAGALQGPDSRTLSLAAVPRAAVQVEALAPLPGARDATLVRRAAVRPTALTVADVAPALPPNPLPEIVNQTSATPGRLFVDTGIFFRRDLAQRQAWRMGRLGAWVEPLAGGRPPQFRVRMGPYPDAAEADRALAGVLAAGLSEVRLVVD